MARADVVPDVAAGPMLWKGAQVWRPKWNDY